MQWPWVVSLPTMLVGFLRHFVTHWMRMYSRHVLLFILEKTSQGGLILSPIQFLELASLWYHPKKPLLTNVKAVPTFLQQIFIHLHTNMDFLTLGKFKSFLCYLFGDWGALVVMQRSIVNLDFLEPDFTPYQPMMQPVLYARTSPLKKLHA